MRQPSLTLARKIPLLVVAAALAAALAVGVADYNQAASLLQRSLEARLVGILDVRRAAIAEALATIRRDAQTQAGNALVVEAFTTFLVGRETLGAGAGGQLRELYLAGNPFPAAERHKLDHANDPSLYSLAHNRFHPRLRDFVEQYGYGDLLFVDLDGTVIYSVMKRDDFAASPGDGGRDGGLAAAFRAVVGGGGADGIAFADFAAYAPAGGATTGFIAAAMHGETGRVIGVLVLAVPVERLGTRRHDPATGRETTATLVIGRDHSLLGGATDGAPGRRGDAAVTAALGGAAGVAAGRGAPGGGAEVPVLEAYGPVDFLGARWAVVTIADLAEVYAPVAQMRNRALVNGFIIAAAIALLGLLLTRATVVRPLSAITAAVSGLAAGRREAAIPSLERGDEIGDIARALHTFRESLDERDRLAAERERRRVAGVLQDAVAGMANGFALFDAERRVVACNRAFAEPYGLAPEAMVGLGAGELARRGLAFIKRAAGADITGDERAAARRLASMVGQASEPLEVEFNDGRIWLLSQQPTVDGGVVVLRTDISERKRMEQALRESEERFRRLAEITFEGVLILENGVIIDHNRAVLEMSGYRPGELIGKTTLELLAPEWRDFARQRIVDRDVRPYEAVALHKDGHRIPIDLHFRQVEWGGKSVRVVTVSDISWRKKAEEARRESEERFRLLVDLAPDGIMLHDAEGIRFLNAAGRNVLGLSALEPVASRHYRDFVAPAEKEAAEGRIRAVLDEGKEIPLVERRVRTVDGRDIFIEIAAVPFAHEGRRMAMAVFRDVTDRKLAETRLREAEAQFRAIAEGVPTAVVISRIAGGDVVFANAHSALTFGVPAEQAVGRRVEDFYVDVRDRERVIAEIGRSGQVRGLEIRFKRADGSQFWGLFSTRRITYRGEPALLTSVSDVTELKEMQQALRQSEQKFRSIAEEHPVPVVIAGARDDVVRYANPAAAALFRVPHGATLGKPARDYYGGPAAHADFFQALAEKGRVDAYETRLRRGDGSEFWASISARKVDYEGVESIILAIVDLTERKAAESEIARQREALHQSEKMSALGSLLAGVAHELNNPLSVVVGQALLMEETAPDARTAGRAEKIRNAAERCARIVRTFLAMARQRPPQRTAVRLNELVHGALDLLAYQLRTSSVQVETDLDPALPELNGDPDQIHQVVTNLVVNAQQAMMDAPEPRRLRIATRYLPANRLVRIEVDDSGPGVAAEIRSRIFEPFYTTKPTGVGTGVGLSVCHGIVEAHGGSIRLEDAPGGGARFVVLLPLGAPGGETAVPAAPRGAAASGRRVLIVDDEPEIAQTLAEILAREGYRADVADSGHAALDRLAGAGYDLVISDLRMPNLDGPGLYRKLKERHPALAESMIVITGDTLSATASAFLNETRLPCIEKPFSPGEVSRLVAETLSRRG